MGHIPVIRHQVNLLDGELPESVIAQRRQVRCHPRQIARGCLKAQDRHVGGHAPVAPVQRRAQARRRQLLAEPVAQAVERVARRIAADHHALRAGGQPGELHRERRDFHKHAGQNRPVPVQRHGVQVEARRRPDQRQGRDVQLVSAIEVLARRALAQPVESGHHPRDGGRVGPDDQRQPAPLVAGAIGQMRIEPGAARREPVLRLGPQPVVDLARRFAGRQNGHRSPNW